MVIIYWYWNGDGVVGWTALAFTAFSLGRPALPCPATLLCSYCVRWVVVANDKSFNPTSTSTSTTSTPRLSLRHPSNIRQSSHLSSPLTLITHHSSLPLPVRSSLSIYPPQAPTKFHPRRFRIQPSQPAPLPAHRKSPQYDPLPTRPESRCLSPHTEYSTY